MALSTMIGTIQFGILVFLETQEMDLRGSLQDSKCDILHIFMRTFLFWEKVPSPSWPCSFFRNIFTPSPSDVLRNPFSVTLQPCNLSDSSKHRLQEKSFFLSVLQ